MPKCIIKTVLIAKRKQNEKNGMNYLRRDEKKNKNKNGNVRAARKVFPYWSQKAETIITHHCLSLFPIVLRLRYRPNGLFGLKK